jgi:hypothetical protein
MPASRRLGKAEGNGMRLFSAEEAYIHAARLSRMTTMVRKSPGLGIMVICLIS